eukprot:10206907-Alexandrium_andersonii.AAC.1
MNVVGGYVEVRPSAGYYLSLSSGPDILEDLPSEEPERRKWKPSEVESPWASDCPGVPEGDVTVSSLEPARA